MMSAPLLFEQDGHVATLTINMPEQRNALVGDELYGLFEEYCARASSAICRCGA